MSRSFWFSVINDVASNDVDTSFRSFASAGSGLAGWKLCILSFSSSEIYFIHLLKDGFQSSKETDAFKLLNLVVSATAKQPLFLDMWVSFSQAS